MKSKFKQFNIQQTAGFSTLEILIAFALLTLIMSGIIIVVFGNDSFAIDSRLNNKALYFAERDLNEARAQADVDFLGFLGFEGTEDDGRYTTEVEVEGITPCKNLLRSTVSWSPTILRSQTVVLETIVSSIDEFLALDSDCPDEPLDEDDWKYPSSLASIDFNPSGIPATDIDVDNGFVYITANSTELGKHDLWAINVSDPDPLSPSIADSLDTGEGLFAVDVAGDYAYVANNATSSQLIVVKLFDDLGDPDLQIKATSTLSGVNPAGSFPQAREIFYYDDHVYVGTWETAGPEFHVFTLDPNEVAGAAPDNPIHVGSRELNHSIRDIVVRGNYAYLATSGNQNELIVLDISSPGSIDPSFPGVGQQEPWSFDADGNEDGTAVYILGSRTYLGRAKTGGGRPNFYIIDTMNPEDPQNQALASGELVLTSNNSQVNGIYATDNLAFFSTMNPTVGFQIWDISNLANLEPWPDCNINEYNHSEKTVGLDYDGKYIYVANESQNALRIFWSNTGNICE